jgi:hypothetical protein
MNQDEVAAAQKLIDSVSQGTGKLDPVKAVFPAPETACSCDHICSIHGESGWLLEGEMRPEGQTYIGVVDQLLGWTTDPNKALRLSRREDADALAELCDDCWKVAEHCWPNGTSPLHEFKRAANVLIDYCEAHDWGLMPEPFDSINPLLKLLGRGADSPP